MNNESAPLTGAMVKPESEKPRRLLDLRGFSNVLAERVGFEPTVQHNCTPDFESGAFDHSATFPALLTAC